MTIAVEERETNNIFVPAGIAAGCAWNSAIIDGTDILRRVPEIGRELKFALDINLMRCPSWFKIMLRLPSIISNLLILLVIYPPLFLKFFLRIVGSLMLSVLITLEILLFCMPVTLLWLEQLFRVIFPNINLLS